ncbi:glycosyl hydrolase [Citricoccus sp. SGAir0253]|uniref:glycosyl hydrolase n=1 Tax=Citricoccus sp. SGAir0253 TaxID=2567881 RepID=UPI0010CCD0A7|nr:glycosyl hydrolase [Citricoccus sp. SGAir0253]QCU78041.1 glycosyl hydrolase [Citricoccus sp. SGAir0253]
MTGARPCPRRRRTRWPARAGVVALAAALLVGCAAPGRSADPAPPWFGGYDDVQVTEDSPGTPSQTTVLSFVVADPEDPCAPSWGAAHDLDDAAATLGLEDRVRDLRAGGDEVAVSFGGAHHQELATVCEDAGRLAAAYAAVVERYGVDVVDLDVEADDLGRSEANARRGEALARLQRQRPADRPLQVWLTVPVGVEGLEEDARALVADTLAAGVDVTGVNLMTMNFGQGAPDVAAQAEAAARAAVPQVGSLYAEAGQSLADDRAWHRIGLTPMIGQNDIDGEVLDLDAAREVNRFARDQGVGRVSYWSRDRDRPCPPGDGGHPPVHDCSGVDQRPGDFAEALGAELAPVPPRAAP